MARARWNGAVIAESDTFEVVEGNAYFPPEAIGRRTKRMGSAGWPVPFAHRRGAR